MLSGSVAEVGLSSAIEFCPDEHERDDGDDKMTR